MLKHSDDDNIVSDINIIRMNVPEDASDLEKIRFIYIKLGQLFSYDYYVSKTDDSITKIIDYNEIGRYQTCYQVSDILMHMINEILPEVNVSIINRDCNIRGNAFADHVANAVSFTDSKTGLSYNIILDLTLDLYRIQANMQTKQFGFTSDMYSNYDIISLKECRDMDENLGFIGINSYFDDKVKAVKDHLLHTDMTLEEQIKFVWSNLNQQFKGIHEAKMYMNDIFKSTIPSADFKEYNLNYNLNDGFSLTTLFIFNDADGNKYYYLLNHNMGLVKTDYTKIIDMLNSGYETNSMSLSDVLAEESNKIIK